MTDLDPASQTLIALGRIADALERLAPVEPMLTVDTNCEAFVWDAETGRLLNVDAPARVDLELLRGIDHVRDQLLQNTDRFARGFAANNVLLWGARGMGKSSLVKAAHANANEEVGGLRLVELAREDVQDLPRLLRLLGTSPSRFIVFCDDLSFDRDDSGYKALKAVLDGGVRGRPANVILYATSNRRHLMPRDMIENERSTAINPSEAVEEKVSLSDRFGLWLGFHGCSQSDYLRMVEGYLDHYDLGSIDEVRSEALEWAATRGSRSGRVAWHFIVDLAGRRERAL